MKRLGIYKISYEQMGRYLNLPGHHYVVDIDYNSHNRSNEFTVKVEGPGMCEVPEGQGIPYHPLDYLERKENED